MEPEGKEGKGADLVNAHLEKADLVLANLQEANLYQAHLEQADLAAAHLEKAEGCEPGDKGFLGILHGDL